MKYKVSWKWIKEGTVDWCWGSASADNFADEAEKLQKLQLLANANGMQRAARHEQVKELHHLIDNKLLELENCP